MWDTRALEVSYDDGTGWRAAPGPLLMSLPRVVAEPISALLMLIQACRRCVFRVRLHELPTNLITFLALLLFAALMPPAAFGAPIPGLINTGIDSSGSLLADNALEQNWKLVAFPAGNVNGSNLYAAAPMPGTWNANTASSRWISPASNGTNQRPFGLYQYDLSFDLTGLNPTTATVSGEWASDDYAMVLLNGVNTGFTNSSLVSPMQAFTPFTISSGFVSGINTLSIAVTNDPGFQTGLHVNNLQGTAEIVPEPAAVMIGILALLGLAAGSSVRGCRGRAGVRSLSMAPLVVLASCAATHVQPAAAASLRAEDIASNGAYNDGWQAGDNGGYGFFPWRFFPQGNGNFFIGDSSTNGIAPSGHVNTVGEELGNTDPESFGLGAAIFPDSASAARYFLPLQVGESFSIRFDNGTVAGGGGETSFILGTTTSTPLGPGLDGVLRFGLFNGVSTYRVIEGSGGTTVTRSTGVPATDDGIAVVVTLTGPSTYALSINGASVTSGQLSGVIDQVAILNQRAGAGPGGNLFFNSLAIVEAQVPEPSIVVMLVIGGFAFLCRSDRMLLNCERGGNDESTACDR